MIWYINGLVIDGSPPAVAPRRRDETMSSRTPLLNACRDSNASRATRTTASGSSPLTWKIGAWIIRATSVEYIDERLYSGAVVKPTWLLTTTWTVPPVRYPRSCERLSVSATTPCPANAASPCTATARTVYPSSLRSIRSCLARTIPSSTGSTASRWDGFATTETPIECSPSGVLYLPTWPRWYLTSPEPCAVFGSRCPSNSEKIFSYGLPTMLASTLSRPRWAMPMTTSSRLSAAAWDNTSSSSGIRLSEPSSENRRCPTYLVCRKVSNASAALSRLRPCLCSSGEGLADFTS